MAKLALALLAAPAVAFVAPGQQAASKVVVKGDIGVDPGPITPGFMFEDTEGLARRRAVEIKHGRISMMAFLGMMVQELGITFPAHDPRRLGPVLGHPQGRHGLRGALQRAHVRPRPDPPLRRHRRDRRHAGVAVHGRPQKNLPGGYDDRRAPSPAATRSRSRSRTHAAHARSHVRAPERPRGHARHVRRHVPLVPDSCDHRLFSPDPRTISAGSTVSVPPAPAHGQAKPVVRAALDDDNVTHMVVARSLGHLSMFLLLGARRVVPKLAEAPEARTLATASQARHPRPRMIARARGHRAGSPRSSLDSKLWTSLYSCTAHSPEPAFTTHYAIDVVRDFLQRS